MLTPGLVGGSNVTWRWLGQQLWAVLRRLSRNAVAGMLPVCRFAFDSALFEHYTPIYGKKQLLILSKMSGSDHGVTFQSTFSYIAEILLTISRNIPPMGRLWIASFRFSLTMNRNTSSMGRTSDGILQIFSTISLSIGSLSKR